MPFLFLLSLFVASYNLDITLCLCLVLFSLLCYVFPFCFSTIINCSSSHSFQDINRFYMHCSALPPSILYGMLVVVLVALMIAFERTFLFANKVSKTRHVVIEFLFKVFAMAKIGVLSILGCYYSLINNLLYVAQLFNSTSISILVATFFSLYWLESFSMSFLATSSFFLVCFCFLRLIFTYQIIIVFVYYLVEVWLCNV